MRKTCLECNYLPTCTWPKNGEYSCGCFEYPTMPLGEMPTDAELLRSLRASWEERGRILDKLLIARMIDLGAVAILIDQSPDPDALSELRGVILEAVEVIKSLRGRPALQKS